MRISSRRDFIKSALLAGAVPTLAGAPFLRSHAKNADVDVVVVGAGVAGLLAAETLRKQGRSVALLEASSRTGGRVHTNNSLFGVPYDLGAHWLHSGANNPLRAWGRDNGLEVYAAPDTETLYVGNRKASEAEWREFRRALDSTFNAIGKAGSNYRDIAPADVVPDVGEWNDTVHFAIGPFEMGKDFQHFSCVDWWSGEGGKDWFCREGYGTLVQQRTSAIEATLNTPVRRIDWSGNGVAVHTASGTLRAKACIVTVSTGVLASGAIEFSPALSPELQTAFVNISMGVYNHLTLQFDRNVFGTGQDEYLYYQLAPNPADYPVGTGLLTNISGSNLSYCEVGGELARELEAEGVEGGVDFALGELRKLFGSDIDKHFVKGHATRWASNPLTVGSYASAEPGAANDRGLLRKAVGDRIHFAGEACSESYWATVNGAYETGINVAKRVHRSLG